MYPNPAVPEKGAVLRSRDGTKEDAAGCKAPASPLEMEGPL